MNTYPTPRAVTQGPLYHWFGYYDMPCWDATGRYLLSLEVPFQDRPPTADDVATIGMTDLESGEYIRLAQTRAFNWQQGAMLNWLPADPCRKIIYNDRVGNAFVSVVLDVFSGQKRVMGGQPVGRTAISDVGQGGRVALGLNFARIAQTRPGYGYAGLPDLYEDELHPAGDGVFVIDQGSGKSWLAVSMKAVYDYMGQPKDMANAKLWFNHTLLNPSETRFAFLARWRPEGQQWFKTLMFTAGLDGSDLRLVLKDGMVSHFDWRNDREILAWTRIGDQGDHFYLIDEQTGEYQIIGESLLTQDGHCSYSHNGKWILTDTYPDPVTHLRTLKIYIVDQDREVIVGKYFSPPAFTGEIRCDLHPRWSRDDRQICFDSVHEGHRQVYVVDTPDLD